MLEGRRLAGVQPIVIPEADGVKIPAYLTLPVGGTGKNLPTVVLPHGGPTARDGWGFDWLAQFLAARGYAVIQPNYRGSAGYGEEWLGQNGFQAWQAAIGDITASARHLVAQGIADPSRLVILGWSYGGYAALQSAAVEPNLYKAAVAIAPVTDLSLLKREASGFDNALWSRTSSAGRSPYRRFAAEACCRNQGACAHGPWRHGCERRHPAQHANGRSFAQERRQGRTSAIQGPRSSARRQQCPR
jgi:dipeptidyl aminopeptidase/acylaminoacyl peptidase